MKLPLLGRRRIKLGKDLARLVPAVRDGLDAVDEFTWDPSTWDLDITTLAFSPGGSVQWSAEVRGE